MSNFPHARTVKGAIEVRGAKSTYRTIQFQYNPENITRSLTPQYSKVGKSESHRLNKAPKEEITVVAEFDATDQEPEQSDKKSKAEYGGIVPQLAALETIIYPKSSQMSSNKTLAEQGKMEIVPPAAPMTYFVFGAKRVLPIKITNYQIEEQEYDPELNPIRAKVTIKMSVLTYDDLEKSHPAHSDYETYHQNKEQAAAEYGN